MLLLLAPAVYGAPILDTYRPSPAAATASIDGLEAASKGDVDVAAWSDYGRNSWVDAEGRGITSRVVAGIGADVHLGHGFLLEASVPMVVSEIGRNPETGADPVGTALASARLRARAMRRVSDHFAVGVALRVETPSLELPSAEHRFRVGPELVLAADSAPVFFGVSGGAYWGALDLRTGFAFHLTEALDATVEAIAAGPANALGAEVRVGARVKLGAGVSVELGGGYGVLAEPGIPEVRAYGGLRVAPRKPPPAVLPAAVAPVAVVVPPVPAPGATPAVAPPAVVTVAPPVVVTPSPVVVVTVVAPPATLAGAPPPPDPGTPLPQPLQISVSFSGDRFATSSVAVLDSFAQQLQDAGMTRVRLEVHMKPDPKVADDFGETQTRADLIRDAMMARGIDGWRVEAMGFGSGAYGKDVVDVIVVE